ncbi:MAG: hypothetical protein GX864_01570 [Mollicutes bacterium]|nr:hypothetical protein [Mollicutes bacterium]
MYGTDLTSLSTPSASMSVWSLISLILAVVGGILVVTLFLKKGNKSKLKGFWKWLYDFLNFDFLTLDVILRTLYSMVTIYIILSSFDLISQSFALFIGYLISGIIITRLLFEMMLMIIKICRNTTEINEKMKK